MITNTYTQRKKKHKLRNLDDTCLRCGLYEHTSSPKLDRIKIQDGEAGIVLVVLGTPTRMSESRGDIAHDTVATVVKKYTKEYLQDCEVWLTSSSRELYGKVRTRVPMDIPLEVHARDRCLVFRGVP